MALLKWPEAVSAGKAAGYNPVPKPTCSLGETDDLIFIFTMCWKHFNYVMLLRLLLTLGIREYIHPIGGDGYM